MRTQGGVSGVNQGVEVGMRTKTCFCLPQRCGSFSLVFSQARWRNLVRVEGLWMIKAMVVGFCSIGG